MKQTTGNSNNTLIQLARDYIYGRDLDTTIPSFSNHPDLKEKAYQYIAASAAKKEKRVKDFVKTHIDEILDKTITELEKDLWRGKSLDERIKKLFHPKCSISQDNLIITDDLILMNIPYLIKFRFFSALNNKDIKNLRNYIQIYSEKEKKMELSELIPSNDSSFFEKHFFRECAEIVRNIVKSEFDIIGKSIYKYFFEEQKKQTTIAEEVGMSDAGVKKRINNIRETLKTRLLQTDKACSEYFL